jgi:hypothetical protein
MRYPVLNQSLSGERPKISGGRYIVGYLKRPNCQFRYRPKVPARLHGAWEISKILKLPLQQRNLWIVYSYV